MQRPAPETSPAATASSTAAWQTKRASWARDAEALLAHANADSARLVLVGNVVQLGNVEPGRSFGQLEDHGMATFKLEKIVRQSNQHTRKAVEAMLAGDAEKAFAALDAGGRRIVEQPNTQTRQNVLAATSPRCPAMSGTERSSSIPLARVSRNSPTPFPPRSSRTARSATMPWL